MFPSSAFSPVPFQMGDPKGSVPSGITSSLVDKARLSSHPSVSDQASIPTGQYPHFVTQAQYPSG